MTDTTERAGTADESAEIPSFFDPAVQDDPFDAYDTMRERCPVHRLPENGLYMVTRYDDVKSVLTDRENFSSNPVGAGFRPSDASKAAAATMAEKGWKRAQTLQRTDPPVHTHYRRLLGRVFTVRRINELIPRMDQLCNELIDAFVERGECEFVADFALPLPGIVICEQLGLDATQYPMFKRWADSMLAGSQRVLSVEEAVEQAEIELEAQHHLAAEFEKRRHEPTDDLISALVHAHGTDEEPLTMEELQDLMHQLITGGFETTTAALGTGLWLLLRHPDQMAKLRANRDLLDNFIDESLRFDSPVAGLWRRAKCPVDVADVSIDADAAVMVRYAAANRDHAKFENPNVFDIERENASEHIAFGWGNHLCVGMWLARAELRCAFNALLDRLDDIELSRPLDEIPHEFSFMLRPLKELPISFTSTEAAGASTSP